MYSTMTLFTWALSAMNAAYFALNSLRLEAKTARPKGTQTRHTRAMRQSMDTSHPARPTARTSEPPSSGIMCAKGGSMFSIRSIKTVLMLPMLFD